MPIIKVCSLFRDAMPYLERYLSQIDALDYPKENLRFAFLEGDSTDGTCERLSAWCAARPENAVLIKKDVCRPRYGHVRDMERTKMLAELRNTITTIDMGEDYVFWIESDMIFNPDVLQLLLKGLDNASADIIAPIIHDSPDIPRFFDIWSYRQNGQEFRKDYPYCEGFKNNEPFSVDSVGAVTLAKAAIYRSGARYDTGDSDVAAFCNNAKKYGFGRIFVEPRCIIWHGEPEVILHKPPPHYLKRVFNRQINKLYGKIAKKA